MHLKNSKEKRRNYDTIYDRFILCNWYSIINGYEKT